MQPERRIHERGLALDAAAPLTSLSAVAIAGGVARGEFSAEEVVLAHLQRIAALDGELNALVRLDADRALATARRGDRERRRGRRTAGRLAGVPIIVKDNIDVRRQATTSGSAAHAGVLAPRDATVINRVRQAGAVLLGRANMDELAMGASTQTSAFGPTRNPWDLRRSPGGSSGGSAAAIAAGYAPLSVGTDTGGSIREPAAQCGVVGMAPTPGLVPVNGVVPFAPGLDRVGPLARTAVDAALLLSVLAGRPQLADAGVPGVARLRVGIVDELCGPPNSPGVQVRLLAALAALTGLGVEVVQVSIPDSARALTAYMNITSAACVAPLEQYVRSGRAGEEVVRRYDIGRALLIDGDELEPARETQRRLTAQSNAALQHCDVLLSPTMPGTAPILRPDDLEQAAELADPMAAPYTDCWTVMANLAGLPSLSVPAGCSPDDGMPVGVMLSGRAGSDGILLALGSALETATCPLGWP